MDLTDHQVFEEGIREMNRKGLGPFDLTKNAVGNYIDHNVGFMWICFNKGYQHGINKRLGGHYAGKTTC